MSGDRRHRSTRCARRCAPRCATNAPRRHCRRWPACVCATSASRRAARRAGQLPMSQRAMHLDAVAACWSAPLPLPYFMIDTGRVPGRAALHLRRRDDAAVDQRPRLHHQLRRRAVHRPVAVLRRCRCTPGARRRPPVVPPRRRAAAYRRAHRAGQTLVVLALFDVYRAPLSHGPGPTNIFGVFR